MTGKEALEACGGGEKRMRERFCAERNSDLKGLVGRGGLLDGL